MSTHAAVQEQGVRGSASDLGRRSPDTVASLTLVAVALVALGAAWVLPWWKMEARAPQYGQRVLVIQVSPKDVRGDVFEVDTLGHYVGIRPTTSLAPIERKLAPFGLAAAFAGLLAAPWLARRGWRVLVALPAVAMPLLFLGDLHYWMHLSVSDRNPDAALNLIVTTIDPKLVGTYDVAQFKIHAEPDTGLYLAGLAALLGLGLAFSTPLSFPEVGRKRAAAGAVGACALVLALPAPARAAERRVAAGGSVAGAVALAGEGDTVVVPAGVFREHLRIGKRIVLRGEPGAVLDGGEQGTIVRIEASGVELRGLTLRASGDNYNAEDAGVRIEHAGSVRLAEVAIEDTLFGVFVVQGDACVIEGCRITGKDLPETRRGDGIRLWYSGGCRIAGNQIERSRDVIIWYSSDTLVEDNVVRHGRYGLHYMYSDRNRFHRNVFEDNQVGATIMYSRGIELTGNAFSFSHGPGGYGLLVKDADDVFVRGNRFIGNQTALFFDGAPQSKGGRAEIRQNLIARNDVGLALQPLSHGLEVWENAFIGNRTQVQVTGSGTAEANQFAVGGRGNFWSDAVTYDRDGDGVSELPYRVESTYEALGDRFPVLAFFDDSPGAEAIDLAARLFPIFAPRPKFTDPHPLVHPAISDWQRASSDPEAGTALPAAGGAMVAAAVGVAASARRLFS